jgi:hypothetical protein
LDAERFDRFVQSFGYARSRRAVFQAIAAGVLATPAAVRGRSVVAGDPTCTPDGKSCLASAPEQCCSGICKKKKGGKARCKKAPAAFGCTNVQDSCNGGDFGCLGGPPSGRCFVNADHVPFCADIDTAFTCNGCADDAACVAAFGKGAFCLACPDCEPFGSTTACVRPAKVKKRK